MRKDNKKNQGYGVCNVEAYLDPEFDWNTIHTRGLLDMLRSQDGREHTGFHKKLKEVLSEREHIPTKREAKELRKKKLKEKENR